jgi:PEP-CTERM motif
MISTLHKFGCALFVVGAASTAQATVLSFDDLSGLQFFVANYRGFQFGSGNIDTTAWFHTDQANAPANPSSGSTYLATDFRLYSGALLEDTQPITSTVPFTFDGAWFSGANAVRYKLYDGSNLVYTSNNSAPLSALPQFVASGYGGLITAVVVGGTQGFYAMDDFTYNTVPSVPEPASYASFALGLLFVARVIHRRQRG